MKGLLTLSENILCKKDVLPSEIITKKYRSLGDRIKLLKRINSSVPNKDYKTLVVETRNAVMHNKDVYPSDETTDNLITCVEVFLGHFHTTYY